MDKRIKHKFISKRTLRLVDNLGKNSINVKRKLIINIDINIFDNNNIEHIEYCSEFIILIRYL